MKNILFLYLMFIGTMVFAQQNPFSNLHEKDGKIGIGTTTPDELLTVKGKIHAQEILVDLNGATAPDYVFEHYFEGFSKTKPDYELISLVELSIFLEENHHLPGIPSAAEMTENGLSLKEMNLKLLQKTEELTLYILEQQKQIEALKEKVDSLLR